MFCRTCKTEVSESSSFCGSCGTAVAVSSGVPKLAQLTDAPDIQPTEWLDSSTPHSEGPRERFAVGQVLNGRYRIIGLLGKGGMGEVFRADDLKLGLPVALKFLPASTEARADAIGRFLNEVRMSLRVTHPNVTRVYDIGEVDGHHYLSMEFVDGEDLSSLLRRIGRLPEDKAIEVARQICAGLSAAHDQGVLHRDLKPANVMLDGRGRVKITDFGLAALDQGIDGDEARAGTPAYMAPEQWSGGKISVQTDLYALGLVLYELFTGHALYLGKSPDEILRLQQDSDPVTPSSVVGVPKELDRIIGRCLEKEPAKRYQDTAQLVRELSELRGGGESAIPSARDLPGGRSVFSRGRRSALAGAAALAVTLATLWLWPSTPSQQPRLLENEPLSIAVLPLRNISQNPEESDYLAEGIGQAVATKLTQAGLRVAPWERVLRADRDQSFEEIADELGVEALLVGSFGLADDRIRATLSVIEVASGFQAWAQEFDEPFEDLFVIQQQIAVKTAESLKGQLTSQEQETLATPVSDSLDAYDFYLQGAYFLQAEDQESVAAARQYFEKALEIDPELVAAHIGLGAAHSISYFNSWGGMEELRVAEQSYHAALRLEPASMRARRGLIYIESERGRWEEILIHAREARRVGRPDDVEALFTEAQGYAQGDLLELSLPIFRHILRIDPLNHGAAWWLTIIAAWTGEFEASVQASEAYLAKFGDDHMVHFFAGISYYALQQPDQAEAHYQKAMAGPTDRTSLDSQLYRGHLQQESGRVDEARATWKAGLEALRSRPELMADSPRLQFLEATFETCLDRAPSREALSDMLSRTRYATTNDNLAAAFARQGDRQRSVELLRLMLDRGIFFRPTWKVFFSGFGLDPDSPWLDGINQDLETRKDELRAKYGPTDSAERVSGR